MNRKATALALINEFVAEETNAPASHFLVMTRTWPGGWYRSPGEGKALRLVKADWRQQIEDYGYVVYRVHPETEVNEMGNFMHPIGQAPALQRVVAGRKNKKA